MAHAGDELDIGALGFRVVFRRTAAETNGELLEYDVIGRPRGFTSQEHLHPAQVERHEVFGGKLAVVLDGRERTLGHGESVLIPAGTPHRHFAAGSGEGHVRVELRPALGTAEFLERLAELSDQGKIDAKGFPRAVEAARLMHDFPREGRPTSPPLPVQRAFVGVLLALADARERSGRPYDFVDRWNVDAPVEAVFDALADARSYPDWWRPVYKQVEADGPTAEGQVSRQLFQGRLPYHLRTTSTITRLDRPRTIVGEVEGDLRGRGVWTLTPSDGDGTHVRFDWSVYADRPLLRVLTPLLRPLFRWNHNWAIARAMEGLEPYARRRAGLRP